MIPSRTQFSLALSGDGIRWFLVNASPDIRVQMERFEPLQPPRTSQRSSPVAGVLLTNADLDHTLGLTMLREGDGLQVIATPAVRESLEVGIRLGAVLAAGGGIRWMEPHSKFQPLLAQNGEETGLDYRAISLPGGPPPYARATTSLATGHSVAYQIVDRRTGERLLVAPDVSAVTDELHRALAESDVVLFDGTFWSEDELIQVNPAARTAGQMGHLPIETGTLELLRALPARLKMYVHINNTNPILTPGSAPRRTLELAGVTVSEDEAELEL